MEERKPVKIKPVRFLPHGSPLENYRFNEYVWMEDSDDKDKYPIRTIFQRSGIPLIHGTSMILTPEQMNAIWCIANCKTGEVGFDAEVCPNCKKIILHSASCNNRNCPNCQYIDEQIWIENRKTEVIDGITYYHIVITIPSQLYPLAYANQAFMYGEMLKLASETVIELCQSEQYGEFTPGIISVLHTWKSDLGYHPHVHMIVTGGGLTSDDKFKEAPTTTLSSGEKFFIPESVIASLFRGKLMSSINTAYDASKALPLPAAMEESSVDTDGSPRLVIPSSTCFSPEVDLNDPRNWMDFRDKLYTMKWVAYTKETFNGNGNAIDYLGRYVYRTAISNNRIHSVVYDEENPDGKIEFWYRDYRNNNELKLRTVTGTEFVSDFMMHVLPQGLCRVRYSGILANSVKQKNLEKISELRSTVHTVSVLRGKTIAEVRAILLKNSEPRKCPCCKMSLSSLGRVSRDSLIIVDGFPMAG